MNNKITSYNNRHVKYAKKLLSVSKFRRNEHKFVLEGARLCFDAYKSGVDILRVFYTLEARNKYSVYVDCLIENFENFLISSDVSNYISDEKSPQGIFCICRFQKNDYSVDKFFNSFDKIVALDNIQDPSNLGNIIRTGEALGIKSFLLSSDCCDLYNPKVLRSSMGSVFRISYLVLDDFKHVLNCSGNKEFVTYASSPNAEYKNLLDVKFNSKSIVFIGNEGNGLRKEILDFCDEKIFIPMKGRAESLNAYSAATILMWELSKYI